MNVTTGGRAVVEWVCLQCRLSGQFEYEKHAPLLTVIRQLIGEHKEVSRGCNATIDKISHTTIEIPEE